MKRIVSLVLASLLAVSLLGGCGAASGSSSQASESSGGVPDAAAPNAESSSAAGAGTNFKKENLITVVRREDGSGTHGAFIELFGIEEKGADGTKTDRTTLEATVAPKTDIMLQNVAGDPYAVGYVSLGSLNDTVKAAPIDGVAATADNVKNGSYPIARPFNIATKGEAGGLARDFIDFIMSAQGQEVVEQNGYIKISPDAAPYSGGRPEGKLVVAGSSSVAPVMEKLKEAYGQENPAAVIEIQQSDSTAGMTAALEGACDIGMASRELKESEKAALTSLAIANDGIAVIVSPQNPLEGLTKEQVKGIYTGELTTWDGVMG